MAVLIKPRWEKFAQGVVDGQCATQAYIDAGFSRYAAAQAAHKLLKHPLVSDRIAELRRLKRQAAITTAQERNELKNWVREQLQAIVARCMQDEPVLDGLGHPIVAEGPDGKSPALYGFDPKNAIVALLLLGKDLGMFRRGNKTTSLPDEVQTAASNRGITREAVLAQLWNVATRAKLPVRIRYRNRNKPVQYTADWRSSNRALMLVGMELGMFDQHRESGWLGSVLRI